jgi:hypothetical protein
MGKPFREHGKNDSGTAPPALQATPIAGVRHEAFPLLDLSGSRPVCHATARAPTEIPDDNADSVKSTSTEEAVMHRDHDAEASF